MQSKNKTNVVADAGKQELFITWIEARKLVFKGIFRQEIAGGLAGF